jgi:hypothetical protein
MFDRVLTVSKYMPQYYSTGGLYAHFVLVLPLYVFLLLGSSVLTPCLGEFFPTYKEKVFHQVLVRFLNCEHGDFLRLMSDIIIQLFIKASIDW